MTDATDLLELPTPSAVLDLARLDANLDRVATRVASLGVALRPHGETHKSLDVARHPACRGITVSTLEELRAFVAGGIDDVMYAVGIMPAKLDAVATAMEGGARVTVVLDSPEAATMVAARGRALGLVFDVCLELDTDGHRAGLAPHGEALLAAAAALAGGGRLAGVMTHAGESYACTSVAAIRALAEQERRLTVEAAERLRAAGHACPVVSVGSTPTVTFAERLDGVTEARVGVYAF